MFQLVQELTPTVTMILFFPNMYVLKLGKIPAGYRRPTRA